MRQDCCGILPTFLSFGTHQGRTTPHVTVNQKPLWAFSSLPPQRNVSFPQLLQVIGHDMHRIIHHPSPAGQDNVEGGVEQLSSWDRTSQPVDKARDA